MLRRGAGGALLGLGLSLGARPLPAVLALPREARGEPATLRKRRRAAIEAGCRFIAKSQRKGDGAFGNNNGVVAITALSVLALMADGSTDGRGRYGKAIRRGLDFLLDLIEHPKRPDDWPPGYFYHPQDPSSKMHGQGYATLALATAIGTSSGRRAARMQAVLKKAVACIEQAQTATGGFGYDPTPAGDHEGSVTVAVAQGLRAARDVGIPTSANVASRGLYYLKRSQNRDGSFRYSVYVERSTYALTAAALSSFFLYGRYTDDREKTMGRGLDYMMRRIPVVRSQRRWYYYGNFYAAWACWQKDGGRWDAASGGYWARWAREMLPHILGEQKRDGSWEDKVDQFEFGTVLPTAFACLTLSVPDETLPIFQR
ncbi:MAG: prenyltransferase/squalene oxidase repeat-containing protein [Planctomycetota bacterium]